MEAVDESVLYEQFIAARQEAITFTDQYVAAAPDDPTRAERWARVVRQTETTRLLLERWLLRSGELVDVEQRYPAAAVSSTSVQRPLVSRR